MQMRPLVESEQNRAHVVELLAGGGHDELAARFREAIAAPDLAKALPEGDAAAICDELERLAVDPDARLGLDRSNAMDFATWLRVLVGGAARRGEPLEWRSGNNGFWYATDSRGVAWDVGPGTFGIGVTVAQWDRPDWWVDTIDEGKALAAEIAARPEFRRALESKGA